MVKILVAEDDKSLNALVCSYLSDNNYEYKACYDGKEALEALENSAFDLIISDIMMPNMDGFAFASKVREYDKNIPILFMTALDDKPSKQLGYKIGIDDYVVKPFDCDLLMLRVGALLRRANIERSRELVVGNLKMNKDEHCAYKDGQELALTVREFDLLFKFLSFPKRTFSRAQLMEEFWDYDSSATSRTVDVYMAKLREKTADCNGFEIVTVHGLGYKAVLK
ncbi:MAG: response regulator transcription factor [Clostridia bacterium]|nr:response regulator transcription factor [Clostridia bacterium]MDE7329459.1 response regulator transcription factor [Clostridia bacterium]